ncbi:MAG: cupin domain-containing protein [Pseudomonadota bacterium]
MNQVSPLKHFSEHNGAIDMRVGMSPFKMRHDLAGNPMFSLEAMADLASELPHDKVDYNLANLPVDVSGKHVPFNGMSAANTIKEIETCGSWIVLKGMEHVPAYNALLDELVDELASLSGLSTSAFDHRVALGFVTSPGGVTPYHLDSEHNFLLQMSGKKTITILPHQATTTAEDTELSPAKSRYIQYQPGFAPLEQKFELSAGDAVCVPFNDPHYVKNGDGVSVSMGITFHDLETWQRRKVATVNHMLRRIGLPQERAGTQHGKDKLKAAAYDALNMVVDPIRNNKKARQFVKRHVLRGAAATP